MTAYSKKTQMRKARQDAMDELKALTEHMELLWLMTLHDSKEKYRAKRLRRLFRDYVHKYDEYKRRYLAADESTVCGNREDTKQLKKQLKDIGFDYDAECELLKNELEEKK